MLQVAVSGLLDRVIVYINDLVQVLGDNLGDCMQFLKVKVLCLGVDKLG